MGYHDVAGHGRQKPERENAIHISLQANVLAAASHVRRLFELKKFTYAVMGELAMVCLGHRCEIRDVLIAYDGKDCNRIKKKLEADRRVRLPTGMNPLFRSTILVQTGPSFLDPGCTIPATIEVTLVPPGSYDTPLNGNLGNNIVLLSLRTDGVLKTFYGLNMLYLIRTLLHFCQIRSVTWEPRKDILFLCQHYRNQLQSIRGHLNTKVVEKNFLRTAFLNQLPVQEQRKCYQTLLGQEPPSLTTLAPPQAGAVHMRSQSASEMTKSQGISRASLPDFLCPPQSQNVKPSYMPAAHTTPKVAEHVEVSPKTTPSPRDSKARYRVVSAPNSRRTSPTYPQFASSTQARSSYIQPLRIQVPVSPYHERAFSHSVTNIAPVAMHQAGQQYSKMQPVFTSTHLAKLPAEHAPTAVNPSPFDARSGNLNYPEVHSNNSVPSMRKEQRSSRLHVVNPDIDALPRTKSDAETKAVTHQLHLVGPEGVYQSPPTSRNPSPPTNNSRTVPENAPRPNDILAELSANIDAALQVSSHPCTSPPPATMRLQEPNRPSMSRPQSAPLDILPASLTIGDAPHQHPSTPPDTTALPEPMMKTNASRYSQQYLAPGVTSMLNNAPASPPLTPAPLSVYKAYQPLHVPASLPKMDVLSPDSAGTEYTFRPMSFGQVKDVDGMGHYFATHDLRAANQSFDASELAMEYRAVLLEFDEGYGGRWGG